MDRVAQSRHGPPSKVDRAQVARLLAAQPDLLLRELAVELGASSGVQASAPQLCRVVKELGLWREKVYLRRRAGHGRKASSARELRSGSRESRSSGTENRVKRRLNSDQMDQPLAPLTVQTARRHASIRGPRIEF